MSNHMDIFEFCIIYIAGFTALLSLTPLGVWPPRDLVIPLPTISGPPLSLAWGNVNIPWLSLMATLGGVVLTLIILITVIGNSSVLGTGLNINTKYLSTIIAGSSFSGAIGVSMTQMMPIDMPPLPLFFLVWVWCILLGYSIIMYAGAGGTGT